MFSSTPGLVRSPRHGGNAAKGGDLQHSGDVTIWQYRPTQVRGSWKTGTGHHLVSSSYAPMGATLCYPHLGWGSFYLLQATKLVSGRTEAQP